MVKLRLKRKGRAHHPIYDIIAIDGRARRDGAFLENLGYYDPNTAPTTIRINHERSIYWLNVGAQPTDVVNKLLSYDGVLLRRALQFKDKPEAEINEAIEAHKKVAKARYSRRKQLRKKRKDEKSKKEAADANKPAE
jgi:small subunit ribosomal protein S16